MQSNDGAGNAMASTDAGPAKPVCDHPPLTPAPALPESRHLKRRSLRITLINQFYTPDISPTAHLCASLAEYLADGGDYVTVLTSGTGYIKAAASTGTAGAAHVQRLWSTKFGSRSNIGRLLDWLTFYIPAIRRSANMPAQHVVIALTTPPFIALAGWIHKLLNPTAKLILWNMDVYPEALERTKLIKTGGLISRVMRSANRAIFNRLDHLVCLDPAMASLLLSQYTPADRVVPHTIIPNWETLAQFADGSPAGGSHEGFVVLYLGNSGYGHEFQTVISAAEILRHQPVKFLFIGGGALRPWLQAQCTARKLTNIIFRDYIPKEQTPAIMRQADCALITLDNNMLGVMSPSKLHANLAMGLPIIYIGPQGGNVDEAIRTFDCGIGLRPGQSQPIADFILRLMNDRPAYGQMRRNAREAFDQAYCDVKTLPMFDAVLASVIAPVVAPVVVPLTAPAFAPLIAPAQPDTKPTARG